jgi:hypothetical protein
MTVGLSMMEPDEPEEGDYASFDGGFKWYQYNKIVLSCSEDDDPAARLAIHAALNNYWPNAWLFSDHGNAHLFIYLKEK